MPSAEEHQALGSETQVRYVLSGQPTGWAAMANEVRAFDEEKVQNCKEDVDTLLVFAGLFSAVLSAFLVAAYPSLQPNQMDMMLYTLERIAVQTAGYNFDGTTGTLASKDTPSPTLPPFQPARRDVLVNVLWFASLTTSLVTASFGMLVKQWLREFLAVEVPSPQARLRLRHFREPQLKTWKVYEIAAILPLLLQLSLALFFLGLCFFTASVHASVGYTTLPLVVGWALCFFAATLLPFFFPLCPYKTTLLKTLVVRLHRKLSRIAKRMQSKWPSTSEDAFSSSQWRSWFKSPRNLARAVLNAQQKNVDEVELVGDPARDVDILVSVDAIQANDELLGTTVAEALVYIRPPWTDVVSFVVRVLEHRLQTMALPDRALPAWPFRGPFPLDSLRPQATDGIFRILDNHIGEMRFKYGRDWLTLRSDTPLGLLDHESSMGLCAFSIVMSAAAGSVELLPPSAISFLQHCLSDGLLSATLCQDTLLLTGSSLERMDDHWNNVARLLDTLNKLAVPADLGISAGAMCFEAIQAIRISQIYSRFTSVDRVLVDWNTWSWPEDCPDSLQTSCFLFLIGLLSREFERGIRLSPDLKNFQTPSGVFTMVFRLTIRLEIEIDSTPDSTLDRTVGRAFENMVVLALKSKSTTLVLLDALLVAPSKPHHPILKGLVSRKRHEQRPSIQESGSLENLVSVIEEKLSQDGIGLSQALSLCHIAAFIFVLIQPRFGHDAYDSRRALFSSLANTIRSLATKKDAGSDPKPDRVTSIAYDDGSLAYACLFTMTFEYSDLLSYDKTLLYRDWRYTPLDGYERWARYFSEEKSIFPDVLVDLLGQLTECDSFLFRLRRLQE